MTNLRTTLINDRYQRFSRNWVWPEFLAAAAALVALIADVGWSRSLGLSQWLTVSIEAVLAAVLLVRVPVAMVTPLPEFVEEERGASRRGKRVKQRSTILRTVGAFSQRFRLRRRVPKVLEPFRRVAGRCPGEGVILALALVGFSLTTLSDDPLAEFIPGVRLTLFGAGAIYLVNVLKNFQRLRVPPLLLFAGTYGALILLGALLLSSPRSTMSGEGMSFANSLFMAASSGCVTGLSLYDVSGELTYTGQAILLILIQIGGLGIMTFTAFASIMVGAGMSIRDRRAISEVLNYDVVGRVGKLVLWILGITLACEAAGVAMLYGEWTPSDGRILTDGEQLWWSVFHAVSGFCNAGFSLDPQSLMAYGGAGQAGVNYTVMCTISMLVILGGLGFLVIMEVSTFKFWHLPVVRRMKWVGQFSRRHPVPRLSLQSKIVLMATAVLVVGGSGLFWVLESGLDGPGGIGVLDGRPVGEQIINSIFHGGIAPRSVGFNSLDCGQFRPETEYLTILLMLIGAAPGSTGGGLKVTAVVILLLVIWSSLRGRPPEIFRRRISDDQVRQVLISLVCGLIVINLAMFLLLVTEGNWLKNVPNGFEDLTFEVASAFATTGLSTGITADFSDSGKVILAFCMFVGRIGPMSLVLALGRKQSARYEYPGESVMLG